MALPGEHALQGREQRCGCCRFVDQFAIRTSALKLAEAAIDDEWDFALLEFRADVRCRDAVVKDMIDDGGGEALGLRLRNFDSAAHGQTTSFPCALDYSRPLTFPETALNVLSMKREGRRSQGRPTPWSTSNTFTIGDHDRRPGKQPRATVGGRC
jgi:hypothetical protein